ncbi:MAG: hypothetical protein CSA33_03195 [Desulfobulbus propionicus]|nr:MAG: hypothetical protein CSA33_03195 [Desulfobulbus propionicus]
MFFLSFSKVSVYWAFPTPVAPAGRLTGKPIQGHICLYFSVLLLRFLTRISQEYFGCIEKYNIKTVS